MPSWLKTGLIAIGAVIILNAIAATITPVSSALAKIPGNSAWGNT